ncbi:MAG TPA: hypothetical protein VGD77_16660 [Gemmatimonadaceae bacterium]
MVVHLVLGAWVAGMLALAWLAPAHYEPLVQEDRVVEWWTFTLFAAAAVAGLARALRGRRFGDLLVALFCVTAAGEEISWGQRLFGYLPPPLFLERNAQQEANLHNLVEAFGQPKWTLVAILLAFGVVAPLAVRVPALRRLADRVRFTAPPVELLPWFAAAVGILVWYPVDFTGEWVEALSAGLFLVALAPSGRWMAVAAAASAIAALGLEQVNGITRANSPAMRAQVACARAEARALRDALLRSGAPFLREGRVHRRLWSLWQDAEVDADVLRALAAVSCPGDAEASRRRAFGVDPWGTAYWVRTRDGDVGRTLSVYSFGPDRRRAAIGDEAHADDVRADTLVAF